MSESVQIFGSLPEGRRLDTDGGQPPNYLGEISVFPRATPERVVAARRLLHEIPDERLDRTVTPWRDSATGETYERLRSYLDLGDPSGVIAFTISDGNILGLRRAGTADEATSVHIGNLTHGSGT